MQLSALLFFKSQPRPNDQRLWTGPITLCQKNGMVIINGRCLGDLSGCATFCKANGTGASTIDMVFASGDIPGRARLEVLPHMPLHLRCGLLSKP